MFNFEGQRSNRQVETDNKNRLPGPTSIMIPNNTNLNFKVDDQSIQDDSQSLLDPLGISISVQKLANEEYLSESPRKLLLVERAPEEIHINVQQSSFVDDQYSVTKKQILRSGKKAPLNFLKLAKMRKIQSVFISKLSARIYNHDNKNEQFKKCPFVLLNRDDVTKFPYDIINDYQGLKKDINIKKQENKEKTNKTNYTRAKDVFNKLIFGVVKPENPFVLVWSGFLQFIICFFLIILPFKISFGLQLDDTYSFYLLYGFLRLSIMMDSLVSMNKAYVFQGKLIKSKNIVVKKYMRGQIYRDILSNLGLYYSIHITSNPWVEIVGFCFFVIFLKEKIDTYLSKVLSFLNVSEQQSEYLKLVNVIATIIYTAHVQACIWHAIAFYNKDSDNWLHFYQLDTQSMWTQYNYSIYWSTTTMITVGYGDITPKNDIELVVNNLCMYTSCGVFAVCVNKMGMALQNLEKHNLQYKRMLQIIGSYMKKHNINHSLQSQIRDYITYLWEQERFFNQDEQQEVLELLSKSLQKDLQFEVRKDFLKPIKYLIDGLPTETSQQICLMMEEVSFSPGETIIKRGQIDDGSIYIVIKGNVQVIHEKKDQEKKDKEPEVLVTKGKHFSFGELSFFTGCPRTATIISLDFSKLYKLRKDIIMPMIQADPKSNEKFNLIEHQMNLYHNYSALKLECYACKSNNHFINDCSTIHLNLDKEFVLKRGLFPHLNDRDFYARKEKTTFKSLRDNKLITLRSEAIQLKIIEENKTPSQSDSNNSDEDPDRDADLRSQFKGRKRKISHTSSVRFIDMTKGDNTNSERNAQESENTNRSKFKGIPTAVFITEGEQRNDDKKLVSVPSLLQTQAKQMSKEDVIQRQNSQPRPTDTESKLEYKTPSNQMFDMEEFDEIHKFDTFQPQHNYDKVLKEFSQFQRGQLRKKYTTGGSPYTFSLARSGKTRMYL